MAGNDPTGSFNPDVFRSGILGAMNMALPNTVDLQPTFRWIVKQSYSTADPAGRPYSWTEVAGATPTLIDDIQVPCAVQFGGGSDQGTLAGFEEEMDARITLLDTQQKALIARGGRMPDQVILAGRTYNITLMTQEALFSVDVYTLYLTAVDA